jgi:hypothetical protein
MKKEVVVIMIGAVLAEESVKGFHAEFVEPESWSSVFAVSEHHDSLPADLPHIPHDDLQPAPLVKYSISMAGSGSVQLFAQDNFVLQEHIGMSIVGI